jgi:integrase
MGVYARKDSKFWWYQVEGTGQRVKTEFAVGTTATERKDSKRLAEAVYLRAQTEHATRRHRLPMPLQESLFRAYAKVYEPTLAGHRGADRERELLKPLLTFFGTIPVTGIDRDFVSRYLQHRVKAGTAASTANREVDLLKVMLRDACPKYLDASPLVGMKRLKSAPRRRRTLSHAEETRLLKVATDPQDHALIVVGLDTLVRLGDLLDLTRGDREGIWLDIRQSKNGEALRVPLTTRAEKALDAIPDEGQYYFAKFRRAENPRDWRGSVNQRLQWLCARCTPPVPFGLKSGVTFHGATRKTGATRLAVEQKQPLSVVQRLGGWKDPTMLISIYNEADQDALLKLVGRVPAKQRKRA